MENVPVSLVRMVDGEHKYFLAKQKTGKYVKQRGQPVVFIHGMAGFAAYLIPKMEYFAKEGYTSLAPDIIGHGERNEVDVSRKSMHDYIADVHEFIDRVVRKDNREPLILVGHSMGGLIAAKLAEVRHDVGHVVLITPAPPKGVLLLPGGLITLTLDDLRRIISMLLGGGRFVPSRSLLESLFADPVASKRVIDLWQERRVSNESFLVALQLSLSYVAVDATKITAPVLVVGAKKDKIVHIRTVRNTAEYYNADYLVLEHLGHMCPFEAGWEETARVILEWLKKKGARP